MEEVPVCRICRCEGTDDDPLFHPCKCRGSIKYIHQDCLMSWLEHSHKQSCDICHTAYTFRTVYDPNTPSILPLSLLLRGCWQAARSSLYQLLLVVLCASLLVVQVPFFVSAADRLLDWQLGCHVPYDSYWYGFVYGEEEAGRTLAEVLQLPSADLEARFFDNVTRGLRIGLKYTIVLGSMLLIQGFVLSDEGFNKIVRKRIGPEPRINQIFNVLHQREMRRELRRRALDENRADNNNEGPDNDNDREEIRRLLADVNRGLRENGQAPQAAPPDDFDVPQNNIQEILDDQQGNNRLFNTNRKALFILQVAVFVDVAAVGVLMSCKTIPSLLGMAVINMGHTLTVGTAELIRDTLGRTALYKMAAVWLSRAVHSPEVTKIVESVTSFVSANRVLTGIANFFIDGWIVPTYKTYLNTINWTPTTAIFERRLVRAVGYSTVGAAIYSIMRRMERGCSQNNPLTGGYRSIYIVLLEFVCVVKVFVLLLIEWAVFPLFCGSQIEFALVPFFNENLYTYQIEPPLLDGFPDFGQVPRWFLGTFFMYVFANFVTMIRGDILRPGVLFFIRPSDDPNVRLVHDALMRPFGLKVYHILLSAVAYSLYIAVELSMVTWGVRLFSPVPILPATPRLLNIERLGYFALFFVGAEARTQVKNCWALIMRFCCARLRLSSFMLGHDVPAERGHVLYKSLWCRLTNWHAVPDHAAPVLEHDAPLYFAAHPAAVCCFVPDGNYVRVPADDLVSRKFVKELFVPVTKDDRLLAPIPRPVDDEERFNPYGDEEVLNSTEYTVVYRPPNFGRRILLLLAMMWFFSMLFALLFHAATVLVGLDSRLLGIAGVHWNPHWSASVFRVDFIRVEITLSLLVFGVYVHNTIRNLRAENGTHYEPDSKVSLMLRFASFCLDYVRDRTRSFLEAAAFALYPVVQAIVVLFGIGVPGLGLMATNEPHIPVTEMLDNHWSAILLAIVVYLWTGGLGGIMVSFNPNMGISYTMRSDVCKTAMLLLGVWLANFGVYKATHPEQPWSLVLLLGYKQTSSAAPWFLHWIYNTPADSTQTLTLFDSIKICAAAWTQPEIESVNALCYVIWLGLISKQLFGVFDEFFHTINSTMKEKYYSSGKLLANAPEFDEDGNGDGNGD